MEKVTVVYDTFKFNELAIDVQDKVIEKHRQFKSEYDDTFYEYVEEEWKEKLEKIGFYLPKIYFSGFWSQGDGACFEASECDLQALIKHIDSDNEFRHLSKFIEGGHLYCTIQSNSYSTHYSHEKTRYIALEFTLDQDRYSHVAELCNRLKEALESLRYSLSKQLYSDLEEAYENEMSEETIKDEILVNEYTYLKDGSSFNM